MLKQTLSIFIAISGVAMAEHGSSRAMLDNWQRGFQQAKGGVTNLKISPSWTKNEDLTFKKEIAGGWQYMLVDRQKKTIMPAFDHAALTEALKPTFGKNLNAKRLRISKIEPIKGGVEMLAYGKKYSFINGKLTLLSSDQKKSPNKSSSSQGKARPIGKSPDGKWIVMKNDGNVILKNIKTGDERTFPAQKNGKQFYSSKAHWNSSSTHFYLNHIIPGQGRELRLIESSPKGATHTKEHISRYNKPGDKITITRPCVFSIKKDEKPFLLGDNLKDIFQISNVHWHPEGKVVYYEYIERGFGKHYLMHADVQQRIDKPLVKEESDTFIYVYGTRYHYPMYDKGEVIWGSYRDGWKHLYLLDALTGKVKNRITKGDWLVRDVKHIDKKKRQIFFTACGKNKGEDPYHIHWYRVNFDGTGLTALTQGDGTHKLEFSPSRERYIDTWSRVDHPPVHELRRTSDGALIKEIARADATEFHKRGFHFPKRFVCKDRNGRFDIWGIIIYPQNFDKNKSYPVIESIYAGPHGAFVPKSFTPWISHMNELCEEGFIVVKMDGLGTNYRHKDFWHFAYKNIMDSGFPDRKKWIKAAAQKYPYMDASRVGIYGGSAGGQSSTAAVLNHGDFYKAAVSDCGCHDNRMDKIWWNEQWMDYPIGKHYQEQSNVTNAHKLKGALMLTVGELDRNVDPASTLQVVNALMKADKDFEYYIAPSGGHGAGEKLYLRRKRAEFFKKHLGEVK